MDQETLSPKISTLTVPFHRAAVGAEEAQAVAEAVMSGWLTMGPKTVEFEQRFAGYVGAAHAIAVNSCTAGLHLALEAIGVREGDEVLVPTNTFTATAEVITYLKARPVLVDIDPLTFNMNVEDASRRISGRCKAIIPVHIAGQPCNMDEIAEFSKAHSLQVVEDAAHALPASYRGRSIGSISQVTAFSFYATKTLTTGDGGMITTDDEALAGRFRLMRLHGIGRDAWKRYTSEGSWFYEVLEAGYKYNLTDIQAALGLIQLQKCDAMAQRRREIAECYSREFRQSELLEVPHEMPDRESAWHLYILRLAAGRLTIDRNEFVDRLRSCGVGTSVHFIPLHLHPYYQKTLGCRIGDFPISEEQYSRYFSLPIFPGMSEEEVGFVIDQVLKVARQAAR